MNRRWTQWIILSVGLVLVLTAARSWVRREGDFQLYVGLGETVLRGGHIYRDLGEGGNTWPPFYALWCAPVALAARLGPRVVRTGWVALNLVFLFLIMRMLARSVYGKALGLMPRRGAFSLASPEMLLPLLLTAVFLNDDLNYLQVNLVILACVTAGICRLAEGREVAGGAWLGFAAALKVLPGLFIPYLFWRGRWRAGIAASVVAGVCSLSPALVFGWRRFLDFVADWPRAAHWGWGMNGPNQSLLAMSERFAGQGRWLGAAALPRGYLGASGDPAVLVVWGLVVAAAVVAMAVVIRPRGAWNRETALIECSAVLTASILLGPLSWYHYFVALVVPLTVLGDALCRRAPWVLVILACLVFPSSSGLVRYPLSTVWLNLSAVTFAGLLVLAACLWSRGSSPSSRGR
ncbi:MAG: glycosyltransferase family 87 protein [Candidatus Coatesbacteria bacterium]